MAGDWMKVEKCTPEKPEIEAMSDILGIDPDAVFGKCFRIWCWFDDHTTDGYAPRVTKTLLDRKSCVTGFGDALENVGWLLPQDGSLVLPNFDRHCGKTAKQRALSAKRMQKQRCADVTLGAQPEKRREEKRRVSKKSKQKENGAPIYSVEFLEFWIAYPAVRKSKKGDAWKSWNRLSSDDQLAALSTVTAFATSWLATDEFCPGPAPWLNQRRWEDDPKSWDNPKTKTPEYDEAF